METILSGLRAIAEPTRLRLLALVAGGELSVSDLVQILGVSQPRVSRHLKVMVDAGLLERRPEGAWVFYRVAGAGAGRDVALAVLGLLLRLESADASGAAGTGAVAGATATDNDLEGVCGAFDSDVDAGDLAQDRARLRALHVARAEAAARYFEENASAWEDLRRLTGVESVAEEAVLTWLSARRIEALLDIGAGAGHLLVRLSSLAARAVGLDQSRQMLALARRNLDAAGVNNAEVRLGDMYRLPFPPRSFDAATLYQVLHFAERPDLVIGQAAACLGPGGRLVVVDLAPHDREELRQRHNHRRLGFETSEVSGWCVGAGLTVAGTQDIPGGDFALRLWVADAPLT